MTLTRISLSNPVAVAVACILIGLFGVISLFRLPVQLTPQVDRPIINIQTGWRAAAPQEVESEIIEPQEDVLRGLPGVKKMSASANYSNGSITLEFEQDVDFDRALIEVINRLNQVPRYPVDASEPSITTGGNQFGGAIAWFSLRTTDDNEQHIETYADFARDVVQARIERVPGIASSNAFGGRGREVRITFDPHKAAAIGVDITAIPGQLGSNTDISAGNNEVGRRSYTVRFSGQYDINNLEDMVLEWRDGSPVRLRDIASVDLVMSDRGGSISQNGGPAIALPAFPEAGVNVLEVMEDLRQAMQELREDVLVHEGLVLTQAYDETDYIYQSIAMVRTNLLLGMFLAVVILWWFLRRMRATLMVALAIPLCLLIAFLGLDALGRTLNIISLAGLAFATGMVLDAAIVVLENIVRLREQGESSRTAANHGATQVWGALFASTITTVAIFLPVIFLKDVAGQLFADLAVTISIAVIASLLVALTVLPTAASKWLKGKRMKDPHPEWWDSLTRRIMRTTDTPRRRWTWIAILTVVPILGAAVLKPNADYLPEGKQNLIFGFVLPPPGLGPETASKEVIDVMVKRLDPHINGEHEAQINAYWLGIFGQFGFFGVRAEDPDKVDQLLGILNGEIIRGFPDFIMFASRASVFGRFGGGRSIDVDLQGAEFEQLIGPAVTGFGAIQQALPGSQVRPSPGLELAEPELRLVPDDRQISEVGWNRARMGTVVRALGDGAFMGEYFDGDRRYNIVLRSQNWSTPEQLMAMPLYTPSGEVVTLGELAALERTAGPSSIRRIDRRRTLTLSVTPPVDLSMEEALVILKEQVEPQLRAEMPEGGTIRYAGSAEDLNVALASLGSSFLLAVVILYLLISALFRSFTDSLLVILTIPMATVGGIVGLRLTNLVTFQPMDLLTMIGFVILLGLVVNNAILLVHQARSGEREGLDRKRAVEQSVRMRLRPIFMSTLTSIFGMLPLLLMPGAGTELYRGLAAVIVGGMLVSTLFTLVLLPSLLRFRESSHLAGSGLGSAAYADRLND